MFPSARSRIPIFQGLRHGFWNQDRSSTVPPLVYEVLRTGGGRPLDDHTRAWMERRFSHDFGRVRIHTDPRAAESVRAVNARAYTVGWDVVFGSGQYAPSIRAGLRLLAHELAHVVQQTSRPVEDIFGPGSISIGQSEDRFERSADEAADAVMRGVKPASFALSGLPAGPVLQRDYAERLRSVEQELRDPRHVSKLQEETGARVTEWRHFFYRELFPAIYQGSSSFYQGIGSLPRDVVLDAAWASAIYEWSAIGAEDLKDPQLFSVLGPQLDTNPGSDVLSMGPFQGYGSMAYRSLRNREIIQFLTTNRFAQRDRGIQRILSGVSDYLSERDSVWRNIIRDELSDRFNFTPFAPVVSLIAKLQVSLRNADEVSRELGRRSLPGPALRWVLLCDESSGGGGEIAEEVKDRFDHARRGDWVSLNFTGNEGTEEKMRLVLTSLAIQFAERFQKT